MSLHILFLTQIIPYPPDAGPKVKTWHVLRYLAGRGHRITLASFMRPEEERYVPVVREVCEAVHAVPIRRSRPADLWYFLRSVVTGRPFLIERDDLSEMRNLVQRILASEHIDAIHTDQLTMTQFALPYSRAKMGDRPDRPMLVFDAHNAVWAIVERMRANTLAILRPVAGLEAARIKRYEGEMVMGFDHTLAVTEPDREALLEAVTQAVGEERVRASRITVVPIAVDTEELRPVERKPGSRNILTLGTLHYPPNADGIRWFMKEVFPIVRQEVLQATLTIIGKNPPVDFTQAAAKSPESIRVTGYVEDLKPYMQESALMVVAVRAGGGMRVRILEAFARAMPVVTTTIGLEGIEATPGEDVLVADTAESFAHAVVSLLQDGEAQAKLAERGRRLAESRYDWKAVLKQMDKIYPEGETEKAGVLSYHA